MAPEPQNEGPMTTRADYTDDEWAGLVRAPILAGSYIAVADMSFFGMIGEMQGLVRAMAERPAPAEAADLIYHLLVLLESRDVAPADVLAVLEGRMGTSGLAEKAANPA